MKTAENSNVKDIRRRILSFVKSKGGQATRQEIKEHLGLNIWEHFPRLEKALKTVKLTPIFGLGEIAPGLFLGRKPVVAYRLT